MIYITHDKVIETEMFGLYRIMTNPSAGEHVLNHRRVYIHFDNSQTFCYQ